jgi:hypothetical protein
MSINHRVHMGIGFGMSCWLRCLVARPSCRALLCLRRRRVVALTLLLVLLHASMRSTDCAGGAADAAAQVSFAANSAGSDGEFQAPALDPGGWEVRKFEQVQRCLACRYVQETAASSTAAPVPSSKLFGAKLLETCPSLPPFLRAACNDAFAAINSMKRSASLGDVCHAAGVCSVPLVDPFETATLLASACEPSRCTIYHHVSRFARTACGVSHFPLPRSATASQPATCRCCPPKPPPACRASRTLYSA